MRLIASHRFHILVMAPFLLCTSHTFSWEQSFPGLLSLLSPQQEPGHLSLQFPSDPPTKTKPSCLRERPSQVALAISAGPGWTHGHLAPSFRNLWCALCHYTHGRAHPSIKFSSFLTQTFWTYLERGSSGVKISLSNLLLVCLVVGRANFIRPAVI